MTMNDERFERQMRLFGKEGQSRLVGLTVAVVGIGGLGTHVVQQLSLLGIGKLTLIDGEELAESNRNRYVGARHSDPVPGTPKVDIGERTAKDIDPRIRVSRIFDSFVSEAGFNAVIGADYVFGCLDKEGARLVLNELCSAYSRPFVDLATEILPGDPTVYGGRVCVSKGGEGCVVCWDLLDGEEAQRDLLGPAARDAQGALYGVEIAMLERSGPSVVSINGVVASLAVTELMAEATGLRSPMGVSKYYGNTGKVVVSQDPPLPDCYYCKGIWGRREAAGVERYVRSGVGTYLR